MWFPCQVVCVSRLLILRLGRGSSALDGVRSAGLAWIEAPAFRASPVRLRHQNAIGQTVGQQVRTLTDISDPVKVPDATAARIPTRRFCPDTEEVTGSNPVSPTQ